MNTCINFENIAKNERDLYRIKVDNNVDLTINLFKN